MKRNLIYLLILVVLGAAVYFLTANRSWGTLKDKEMEFSVTDTASVFKIFIADMQGRKAVLERNNTYWTVNKKYEVRRDYINSLLSTLKRVEASYPVPQSSQKTVITSMASDNKKVEIYDKDGDLLKSYVVGGPSLDSKGTYMLMEGSKTPFVTSIPGWQGVLNTRYVTDEEEIRSRNIFSFRINEIANVSVVYTSNPDSSFSITVAGPDSFILKNNSGITFTGAEIDESRIRQYLQMYEFINCEAFQNSLQKRDSVVKNTPFSTITLTDKDQKSHEAVCYYMPRNLTSEQFDSKGNELDYDIDRYFATINNGSDFVIIQQFHFGRLFKSFDYFLNQSKRKIV